MFTNGSFLESWRFVDQPKYGSMTKAERAEWDPISGSWSSISERELDYYYLQSTAFLGTN